MELIQEFKNYLLSQKNAASKATVKNYVADVKKFIVWIEAKLNHTFLPHSVTKELIQDYKTSKSAEFSASSLDRQMSSLKKFFEFLKLEGQIAHNPFQAEAVKQTFADPWHLKEFKDFLYVYNASHLTIKNYLIDVKQFFAWAEQVAVHEDSYHASDKNILSKISDKMLEEYKERLVSEGSFSGSSINRKLSSLRKYLIWAHQEGFLTGELTTLPANTPNRVLNEAKNIEDNTNIEAAEEVASLFHAQAPEIQETKKNYSKIPPIRLAQKIHRLMDLGLEYAVVFPLAHAAALIKHRVWIMKGKPVFVEGAVKLPTKPLPFKSRVKNLSKSFYNPLSISITHFPWHKKVLYHIQYTRPGWYRRYSRLAAARYFNLAILMIFCAMIGFGLYTSFFSNARKNPTLASLPTAPPRVLSFQGRLTDNNDNPITTANTHLRFAIYDSTSATGSGHLLWQEVDTVSPDSDGDFSTILGNGSSCGSPTTVATGPCQIPSTLFSQNASLYLGVTVEWTDELAPRQQIATVAFASNSETLQGLPPITAAGAGTTNVVLALDSGGNLGIAASTTFQSTTGSFTLSGNTVVLNTNSGSNGNITLAPDGSGTIDLQKPLQNSTLNNNIPSAAGSVEVDDLLSVLATSSGQSAVTINQNSTGPLISASTSGVAKFTVDNSGNVFAAGNVTGQTIYTGGGVTYYINNTTSNLNSLILAGNLTVSGNVLSSLVPDATTRDLGSPTNYWGTLYATNIVSPSTGVAGYWQRNAGAVEPTNITDDLLLGSTATSTAKFGFINVAGGTPTATISSNFSLKVPTGNAPASSINLLNNGSLGFFNSVGGDAGLSANPALFIANSGNVGLGTNAPAYTLDVTGNERITTALGVGGALPGATVQGQTSALAVTGYTGLGGLRVNGADTTGTIYNGTSNIVISRDAGGFLELTQAGAPAVGLLVNTSTGGVGINTNTTGIGNAQFVVNQTNLSGAGDIFAASTSGITKFVISNSGTVGIGSGIADSSLLSNSGLDIEKDSLGNATLVVHNTGTTNVADLITASNSAGTKFRVANNGDITGQRIYTGEGTTYYIDPTTSNLNSLTLANNLTVTGNVASDLIPSISDTYSLGSDPTALGKEWLNIYAKNLFLNGQAITQLFQRNAGVLSPINITDDLAVGGISTASAKFQVFGLTGNATTSGTFTFAGGANNVIAARADQGITIGDSQTGNVNFSNVNVGINATNPLVKLDVRGSSGTTAVASISGQTSFATTVIDNAGSGDLLTGSTSGQTRFYISNNGSVVANQFVDIQNTSYFLDPAATGTSLAVAGSVGIGVTNPSSFKLQVAGNVGPDANNLYDLGANPATGNEWNNIYGQHIFSNGTELTQYWQRNSGALSPFFITDDLLLGATSTTSARFAVTNIAGGTPTASLSAGTNSGTYLTADGTLATRALQSLTLGSTSTGNINVGSDATARTLSLGNTTGTTGIVERVGTGNYSLDGVGGSTYSIGASTVGGTISIGGASQTGITSLGISTATNTINIGHATVAGGNTQTINIGDSATSTGIDAITIGNTNNASSLSLFAGTGNVLVSGAAATNFTVGPTNGTGIITLGQSTAGQNINIGSVANTSAQQIQIGNGASAANSEVDILSGVGTVGAGTLKLADNKRVTTIDLGNVAPDAARTTNFLGGNASQNDTLNILAGAPSAGTQTVNILTGNASGGTQAVNIGSGTNANTITIGGSGASTLNIGNSLGSSSSLNLGSANSTTTIKGTNFTGGAVAYATSNTLNFVTGSDGQCLLSHGSSAPTFGLCTFGNTNYWDLQNGALFPINSTLDLLVGGTSTGSAKFGILHVDSGTPTASVSSGLNGNGLSIDASGTIQTTNNQTLTIGGNTTGNIILKPQNNLGTITFNGYSSGVIHSVSGLLTSTTVDLQNDISSTLLVNHGGTGLTSLGSGSLIYGSGSTTANELTVGADNSILNVDSGTHVPKWTSSPTLSGLSVTGTATFNIIDGTAGEIQPAGASGTLNLGDGAHYFGTIYANNVVVPVGNGTSGFWQLSSNVLSPVNNFYDFAVGGSATGSATPFQVFATTVGYNQQGTASSSGGITFRKNPNDTGYTPTIKLLDGKDLLVKSSPGGDEGVNTILTITNSGAITAASTLAVNGDTLSTSNSTFNLVNTNAGTLNFAGASNTIAIAKSTTNTTLNGNVTLGSNVGSNTLELKAKLQSSIIPNIDNNYSLGNTGLAWQNLYVNNVIGDAVIGTQGYWQVTNNGNVISPAFNWQDLGIGGTATSSATYQVFGSSFATDSVLNSGTIPSGTATTSGFLTFRGGATDVNLLNNSSLGFYTSVGGDKGLAATANPSLFVANSGNSGFVGIGTNNPLTALQIAGSASISANLTYYGNGTAHLVNVLQGGTLNFQRSAGGDTSLATTLFLNNNGSLGIGTTNPLATLDIRGNSGTTPVASISGKTSFASLVVNNDSSTGDIFSASASSWPRFTIANDGTIKNHLIPNATDTYNLGSDPGLPGGKEWDTLYVRQVVTPTGNLGSNYWQLSNQGTLAPAVLSNDLAIGGNSTGSAKFQVFANSYAGEPAGTASLAGNLTFNGAQTPQKINLLNGVDLGIYTSPGGDPALANAPLFYASNSAQRIGIGTSTPQGVFDVASSGSTFPSDLTLGQVAATNWVGNPSFEGTSPLNTWSFPGGSAQWSANDVATESAVFGSHALKFYNVGPAATYAAVSNCIPVYPSTTYTLSAYLYKVSGFGGNFGLEFQSYSDNTCTTSLGTTGTIQQTQTNTWSRLTTTVTLGATAVAVKARIVSTGTNTNSRGYADGIQLEQASTATPYLDGSMGPGYYWDNTGTPNATDSARKVGTTFAYHSLNSASGIGAASRAQFPTLQLDQDGIGDVIAASVSGVNKFVLTNAGYVGIGGNNPTAQLTINQSSDVNIGAGTGYAININNANGSNTFLKIGENSTSGALIQSASLLPLLLNANGNSVGIGTTSPLTSSGLHVEKNSLGNALVLLKQLGSAGDLLVASNSAGAMQFKFDKSGILTANSFLDNQNTSYFLDPAATNISQAVAGKVGIGTTSPYTGLEVASSSAYTEAVGSKNNPAILIHNTQSSNFNEKAELQFSVGNNNSPNAVITALYTDFASGGGPAGLAGADLAFSTKTAAGGLTEAMRIKDTGNVAIGTTSIVNATNDILQVNGSSTQDILLYNPTGAPPRIHFRNGSSTNDNFIGQDSGGNLGFFLDDNTTEALTILNGSGNVGIGTTNPGATLDIGSSGTIQGAGLSSNCGAQDDKLLWSSGTKQFLCGTDRVSSASAKPTQQDFTTTTLTNVTSMGIGPVAANDNWIFFFNVGAGTSSNISGIKLNVTTPASPTACAYSNQNSDAQPTNMNHSDAADSCNGSGVGWLLETTNDSNFLINGYLDNGANTGNIQLQAAENVVSGTVHISATSSFALGYKVSGADVAEIYFTKDITLAPGDVVSIDPTMTAGIKRTTSAYDKNAIGVISTQPGQILAAHDDTGIPKPLGLTGRVPVKVTTENGPIMVGDILTSSDVPGYAMKARHGGQMIGKAMVALSPQVMNPCPNNPQWLCGETLMFINNTYSSFDPNATLTDTGDLQMEDSSPSADFTIPHYYTLADVTGAPVEDIAAFASAAIGNLRAGSVQAQQVLTNSLAVATDNVSIAGQSLHDYIAGVVNEVLQRTNGPNTNSPIAEVDQLHTNLVSPLASDSAVALDLNNSRVSVKNSATGQTVATIDNAGNATFSGTLQGQNLAVNGDATISGTLHADRIEANSIAGLQAVVSTLSAQNITNVTNIYMSSGSANQTGENIATGSGSSSNNNNGVPNNNVIASGNEAISSNNYVNIASYSAYLSYVPNLKATTGEFEQGLISLGPTSLTDTSISGTLSIGSQMFLADTSINVLGGDLQLQPLKQGGIAFVGGKIRIDSDGNLTVNGKSYFNDTLAVKTISPLAGQDVDVILGSKTTPQSDAGQVNDTRTGVNMTDANSQHFNIKNSSGSAVLSFNQLGDIVASGAANIAKLNFNLIQPAMAVSDTEVVATSSAGTAAIKQYQTQLTIDNKNVTPNSLIYITPVGNTASVPYLMRQIPGTSFTVGIQVPSSQPVNFNWLIVN